MSGWVIVITARYVRWLPWPWRTYTFESPPDTTWAQAHALATEAHERGAHQVSLYPAASAPAPAAAPVGDEQADGA